MGSGNREEERNGKSHNESCLNTRVRNLQKFVGPEDSFASEDLIELETKRLLLELFKERQKKTKDSEEPIVLPTFYKQKPAKGSVAQRVQILSKFNFLQKQTDLVLNTNDIEIMWVCLRENSVIDDVTDTEKIDYMDFCQIASLCEEQIGPKCKQFFLPSNFMKFEKDDFGRIAILPFYLYVMRSASLTQARIDMTELDEDGDGYLQPDQMEAYIRGLIPNLAQLQDMPAEFVGLYCRIAARMFLFFCDPYRRGKLCIKKVLLSNCLGELMELHQANKEEFSESDQGENWFSFTTASRVCDVFLSLDKDMNKALNKQELQEYVGGSLSDIFIERVFDEYAGRARPGEQCSREIDFDNFLDFVMALEHKDSPEALHYLFRCLDLNGKGYLTNEDIHFLFRDVYTKLLNSYGNYDLNMDDVKNEIWDIVKPADPLKITITDLLSCKQGGTLVGMLIDVREFWAYDNREDLLHEEEEEDDDFY